MRRRPPLFRVAITGGPCGGKTTAVARMGATTWKGFAIYPVQEVASILIATGLRTATTSKAGIVRFQRCNMRVQIAIEDAVAATLAGRTRCSVVVHDRGIFDSAGFIEPRQFGALLHGESLSSEKALLRYDMVVHLVTAAKGAERFYTRKHAVKRFETLEAARRVDERILQAWSAHPRLVVIKSRLDFDEKIAEAIRAIRDFATARSGTTRLKRS